ncbi:MAG: hypothetical protein KDE63_12065 [Novosphingobium sp.]|nr:hypothetical protein [Novosphingobium sp.]
MAKHLLLAMTNPLPGKDAEFNDWYDNTAYPTYKSLPGLVPLGRFKAVDVPKMFPFQMDNQFAYLSLYYFETDDVESFLEKLKETFPKRPEYSFSETIDQNKFFEPIYVAMGDLNFEPIDRFESLKR